MANRYWVGGSGNWNSTSHWSDTSGGASGASVPTSADDVFVDANSGSGYININTTCNCLSIDFTGSSITTVQGSYTLNVYGSFTGAAGITWSHSGSLYFQATSTGKTITSAGITFSCNVYLQGAGGGWTLQDEFTQASGKWFYCNYGTFNTNNQTCTFGSFSYSNTNIKDLTFGSSTITVQGSLYGNATNTTIDMGTATWHFANGSGSFSPPSTHHLYNVVSDASCTRLSWGSSLTIDNNFTIEAPTEYVKMAGAWSITITGNLIVNGTEDHRVILDGVFGTMTLTVGGTVSLSHCDFNNVNASGGGGTPWTGTRLGKWYNVSNITTDTPRTLYWVGDGGNYSSTTHWSTSSGGSSGANPPLPQDTVIFDANSISSGSQTITCDRYCMGKNFNSSAVTNTPTFAFASADTVGGVGSDITGYNFTDSVNLGPINVTIPAASETSMVITNDTNPTTCEFYPHTGTGNLPEIYLNEEGGVLTVNLNGELNAAGLTMGPVTFNSNNYDININSQSGAGSYFGCSNSGGQVNLGTSVVTLDYNNGSYLNGVSLSGTWTGNFTLYLYAPDNANTVRAYWYPSSFTIYHLRVDGKLTFNSNYNLTITNLTLDAGCTLKLKSGYTTYIDSITSNGTAISEANLQASSTGSAATISKASGELRTYETAIKDSTGSGGASFRAVASTNVSGNSGWVFVEEGEKTASSKANMHATVDVTASSKAAVAVSGVTKTASSKAEIVIDRPIKTASSKANILPQKEAQNKARIKTTGTEKTASSKALIDAHKRFWVGDSGDWNDTAHWSYSSGGAGGAPVPTQYDDAIFDANSFSTTGQTVTISTTYAYCKDVDWSAVTNSPTWDFTSYRDIYIYGNFYLNANMTCATSGGYAPGIFFYGTGSFEINTYGCVTPNYEFLFYENGNTMTLMSNVDCRSGVAYDDDGGFYINDGNLDLNDYNVYVGYFDCWSNTASTIDLGTGEIHLTSEYGYYSMWADNPPVTVTGSPEIHIDTSEYDGWNNNSVYHNPAINLTYAKLVLNDNGYVRLYDGGHYSVMEFMGVGYVEMPEETITVDGFTNHCTGDEKVLIKANYQGYEPSRAGVISSSAAVTASRIAFWEMTFTGGGTLKCDDTCMDCGLNTGITFTRTKGERWDFMFEGDTVPATWAYWYYQSGADPTTNESTGGAWHIVCPEGRYRVYGDFHCAIQDNEAIQNAIGHTAEVRFKSVTDNNTNYALTILSQNDDVTYQDVYVKNGQIVVTDGLDTNTIVDVDPTEYHVYRGTVIGNTKKLYIDGVLKSTLTGAATGGGAGIYFGPWSSGAGNANDNEGYWDYVYYRVDGAFDLYDGTAQSKARIKSSGVTKTASSKAFIVRIGITYTAQSKARVWQLGTTKTADSKARIQTTGNTVTASAKARIKVLDNDKTADSKALILKVWDKTAQALARIKQLANTVTATTKARIKALGTTVTAGSKARIKVVDNDKTATAKARIKQVDNTTTSSSQARIKAAGNTKTASAKARIKRLAQQATASSKALIKFIRTKTATTKARILQTFTKTASTKARIKSLGYVKTAGSKARIKSTGTTKSASSRARIHQTYTKTAQSKARVVYRRTKTASSKAVIVDKRRWYVERPQAWQTKPSQAWYTPSEPTWNNETPADWYDPDAQDWQDES